MLEGKRVLFIGPEFFNYHTHIINKLKELGADVVFFKEKNLGLLYRLLKNTNSKAFNLYNRMYEKSIERKIKKYEFDYFFLIRGEHISIKFIEKVRILHKNAKFIYYQWDSFKNNPNALNIYQSFDKCFSFDKTDCIENNRFNYLQLFYIDEYKNIRDSRLQEKYDVLFVGTFHGDRLRQVLNFEKICMLHKLTFKFYLYLPLFEYLKYSLKNVFAKNPLRLKQLNESDLLKLVEESKAILDLPSEKQNGLTIRTFEALAANKKLITTNNNIRHENFYSESQILMLNQSDLLMLNQSNHYSMVDFINKRTIYGARRILSIGQWINSIFKTEV